MGKIRIRINTPFGEIVIEGENAQEILKTLKSMPPQFMNEIAALITSNLSPSKKSLLDGIIEITTEGPIITTREKITHYEAIGLVLFSSDKKSERSRGGIGDILIACKFTSSKTFLVLSIFSFQDSIVSGSFDHLDSTSKKNNWAASNPNFLVILIPSSFSANIKV